MIKQCWSAACLFLHILAGVLLLVLTGSLWNNKTKLVKRTKQWWLARTTRLLGIAVRIRGEIPKPEHGKGVLFVSNHVSWIDIPLIGGLSQLNFLSKAEVRNWPIIGKLADGTGTLFIQRGSGDAERVSRSIADYLDAGRSVLFFPEGTTSDGRQVRRFHGKLFKAAQHTAINVCPVAIHYHLASAEKNPVPFIGDDEFAEHLWNLLRYKRITATVEFLPLRPVDMTELDKFVKGLQQEVASSVAGHHARYQANTNTLSPGASIPCDLKDEAASF
ncbi:lysophospholipid acyltransferase family protein [Ketobacter sp.]|uniref:lysophospholipid acyltransferase family protein n=1 Tax=Ketobacter sp. TaxID=2083498 RepID=UPI000F17FB2B|nr:lysophospholipid acyltransferase family protein [Ketobacter sp.]RLT97999.1 MAG: 1-acyl-sn-glycerol-3-phosphate acyltransferase [Ketobacter sp.]